LSLNKQEAMRLALEILSPEGQQTLKRFGFSPVGIQQAIP